MGRRLFVLFYLAIVAAAGYLSADLEQKNEESLFMTSSAQERYREFRTRIGEPNLLAARTLFDDPLTAGYTLRHRAALQQLAAREGVSVIGVEDLGPLATADIDALPRLQDERSLAFIAIVDSEAPVAMSEELVANVLADPVLNEGELQVTGLPYVNHLLDDRSRAIKTRLFPAMFVLAFFVLLFCTRNPLATLVLYVPAIGSFAITLAAIAVACESMNMITSIVPLITFVLTLTLGLQVWGAAREMGSVAAALREKARPITLTVVTTGIGFGSLYFSEITAIRQFAGLSFVCLLICSALTVAWILAVSRAPQWHGPRRVSVPSAPPDSGPDRRPRVLFAVLACLAVLALGAWAIPRVKVDTDAFRYFSSEVQEQFQSIHRDVLGVPILEVVIAATGDDEAAWQRAVQVDRAIEAALPDELRVLSWRSLVDAVGVTAFGRELSGTPRFAGSAHVLLPKVLRDGYPTSHYRITYFGESCGYDEYRGMIDEVEAQLASAGVESAELNGMYYNLLASQNGLVATLVQSFAVTMVVIGAIFILFHRRTWLLGIFALINLLPVAGGLAAIWLFGFSLNVATVMVFSVSLGIAVDATLHVIHGRRRESLAHYAESTRRPIIYGAMILVPSFAVFGTFGFLPIQQFGVTLATTLALALVFDLWVLPRFLDALAWQPREAEPSDAGGAA